MNESDIFRFICANKGAVDTDDLVFNLGAGDPTSVLEIISNQDKFAACCPFGLPKVVARSRLRLCRARDCPGSCRGLHLCRSFLFSGSCPYIQSSSGCCFSHELHSDHNLRILGEHELESLSRAELCTLLLQSDDRLLPPICYDYNNGDGGFGQCQNGNCKRLHICERYLNRGCRCPRTHDLAAPQPLKALKESGVPDDLIGSLKSTYANILALKYSDCRGKSSNKDGHQQHGGYRGNRGNRGNRDCFTGDTRGLYGYRGPSRGNSDQQQLRFSAATYYSDTSSNDGENRRRIQNQYSRGRALGRGGVHGGRGNRGKQQSSPQTCSIGDLPVAIVGLEEMDIDGPMDTGPDEGNTDPQEPTSSNGDLPAATSALEEMDINSPVDTGPDEGNTDPEEPTSSNVDLAAAAAAANNTDASSGDGQDRNKTQSPNETSTAVGGRGGSSSGRGNHQQLQRSHSSDDTSAAVSEDVNGGNGWSMTPYRRERQRPVRDKTEICMFFIKGNCIHEERCYKAHDKIPYRWEVREGDRWTAVPDNETIEKDYCDPKKTCSSSSPPVCFDTMTCGPDGLKVRRLSTANSVLEPTFILTTEWVWYWEDEFGNWNMYASTDGGHTATDMGSSVLEQKFQDNSKDVVEFSVNSQSYSLSFQDMMQTNKDYGTKRVVRRRPRFVSVADVQARRVRKPVGQMNFGGIPAHWDKTQVPLIGDKRISLQCSSEEYKEIESLFCATMKGFDIVKIERIQNKALWDPFQLQKIQMKHNNGGRYVTEKKLFHGTDNQFVDVICKTNFDWRVCGTHGTAYGNGCYFARDAKYSHSYTSDSDVKSMFIARLLVGHYTRGSPNYRKPPPKDGGDISFYDSCVDDVRNPSIYVVFEKSQIYPEYLLQYKTMSVPVAAPRPAPIRSSSTTSYQPSTSSYQPSTSSYQPSTSSYQPSASVYKPSTKKESSCIIA